MNEVEHATRFLKARWVLTMDSPPVENGIVELLDDRIVAVYRQMPGTASEYRLADHVRVHVGLADPGCPSTDEGGCPNDRRRLPHGSNVSSDYQSVAQNCKNDQHLQTFNGCGSGGGNGCGAVSTVECLQGKEQSVIDYGDAVILPGFVNLHSHIEYTKLRGFDTCASLFSWIPGLMAQCRSWQKGDFLDSARVGAMELLRTGTTCVVDSSYTGQAAIALGEQGLRGVVALELFGVDSSRANESWAMWLEKREQLLAVIASGASSDETLVRTNAALKAGTLQISVAPHALYTVSPQLMKLGDQWSADNGLPITVHVAESPNESSWTQSGDECVDQFLSDIPGVLPVSGLRDVLWRGCRQSPVAALDKYGLLSDRLIAAHCVHVAGRDLDLMAVCGMTVAHCPRSNARLRNGVAPLAKLVAGGVPVGFGTDSAASNDNLSLLEEARFATSLQRACDQNFGLEAEKLVRMLTCDAAKAAGMSHLVGTLTTGKLADMVVFNIGNCGDFFALRPYEALVYGPASLQAVYVGGKLRVGNVL